jgi:FAD/FMN-containing dehydrogenase
MDRRQFIKYSATLCSSLTLAPYLLSKNLLATERGAGILVNDIHSELNPTLVHAIIAPRSIYDIKEAINKAKYLQKPISIAANRHSMGGQQFATGSILLDMTSLNKVLSLDIEKGIIEVESGITWVGLNDYLYNKQKNHKLFWTIIQKQTGADELSLGGALSSNIHGRGLVNRPIVEDVESFTLVNASGELLNCSRTENNELFKLVIGGYGLFGVIYSIKLRLMKRVKVKRVVSVICVKDVMPSFHQYIEQGYTYGDFQYMTDENSEHFMNEGVFSCYLPVGNYDEAEIATKELSDNAWKKLYQLAHSDKTRAFEEYAKYYLSTNGQVEWSDKPQFGVYLSGYHNEYNRLIGSKEKSSLMISELYVPRDRLTDYMAEVRKKARSNKMDIIYGTVRLIKQDTETFLPWAKQDYACIIFNLRVIHTEPGINKVQNDFRDLIDMAIAYGGSYYLTYHHFARKDQTLKCYPELPAFLKKKKQYDPIELFQSDWYNYYKKLLD